MDPLATSGGQDRLSPYAAMGNQPEFAVDPEGLVPQNFQAAGLGSPPEEGGPASSGWNMLGKGSDMWYESYMNFGGSKGGGSGGGASAASENAIPNTSAISIYTMIGIARNSPGGTANFNNWGGNGENKNGQSGSGHTADDPIAMEVTITGKKPQLDKGALAWLDSPPVEEFKLSLIGDLEWKLNRAMEKNWIGNLAGPESSWIGKDGFKNKGWPTIKITVGVISTAFSAGALGFYMTSASATTIGTTIQSTQLGIGAYSTVNDIIQQASPYSLPYSEKMNNVNAISNLYDAARFNPIGIIGIGMWYSDYKQNKR